MDASVDAPSAATGPMSEEVEEVEDVGTTAPPVRSGATGPTRTIRRTSLLRALGGTSLVRTILREMLVSLRCRHSKEGTTTIIRTRGLEASRSRALSLASWAVLRP